MTGRKFVVRIFRCQSCGVEMKGRATRDGRVLASNAPLTDDRIEACACRMCAGVNDAANKPQKEEP